MKVRFWMVPLAVYSLAAVLLTPARRRLRPQLVEGLETASDDLLAIVSHDLKGPLAAIQIGVDFMKHLVSGDIGACEKDLLKDRLDALECSITQASNLIQSLLDSKKIQLGGLEICKSPGKPSDLVEGCLRVLSPLAERKSVNLKVEISCDDVFDFDMDRMKQVLSNLIINGIQHMDRYGRLTIGNEDLGSEVRFYVTDDGYGVNPAEKNKIFDLYWQGIRHNGSGSGMGLAIAKAIVELHGGRIWVDSEPGKGSCFQFAIPKERCHDQRNAL